MRPIQLLRWLARVTSRTKLCMTSALGHLLTLHLSPSRAWTHPALCLWVSEKITRARLHSGRRAEGAPGPYPILTAATELGFSLNNSKWAFLQLFFSLENFLNKYLSLLFSYMDFLLFFPNEEWIYSVLILIVRNLFCPRSTQESSRVNCWEDNSTSQSGLGVRTRKTSSQ